MLKSKGPKVGFYLLDFVNGLTEFQTRLRLCFLKEAILSLYVRYHLAIASVSFFCSFPLFTLLPLHYIEWIREIDHASQRARRAEERASSKFSW